MGTCSLLIPDAGQALADRRICCDHART